MNLNKKGLFFTIIGLVITGIIMFADILGLVFNTKIICGLYQ
jgi:hypothetical protein